MKSTYSSEQLRSIFQSSFNLDIWREFLYKFFEATELKVRAEFIRSDSIDDDGYYLGKIDRGDFCIGLFYYEIKRGSVLNRRVGLRNLVRAFINPLWGEFDAALVVFDSGDHWRFSFICDIKGEATAPKRYTYVFGSSELLYRTPIDRFLFLQSKGISFENLKKAFSVEALSDEFFDKYREQYADFVQYITGKRVVKVSGKWEERVMCEPNNALMKAFDYDEKKIRDYIKKMMGRITFLHFLQRKGWLCGDLNYMQNMFERSKYKDNYLDAVLEPLFFGILNTKPAERESLFKLSAWDLALLSEWKDIPYLNGGLFECDEEDEPDSVFPADYFERLFNFFSEYNFTIDENDPNDAEVGVDPEMLGKIFENLLEDNKDKGAFYTPKEIVLYMCQESLIAYLETSTTIASDKLRNFVLSPEEFVNDIPSQKVPKLVVALQNVKICDPAIGSGAFPMGLLNQLLRCREALSDGNYNRAKLKQEIIQNNIYGVDIEKGAVDIARLRFWLSIVVDEDTPSPLPNLDYKIMQGNSLIESFEGIDLSNLVKKHIPNKNIDAIQTSILDEEIDIHQNRLLLLLSEYFTCCDHDRKVQLQNQISKSINAQLDANKINSVTLSKLKTINIAANNQFFLWHTWFADVFANGGFDIVIGNPPYIQLEKDSGKLAKLYENCSFCTFKGNGDIYCLFYEQGWNLLKSQAILCFITSNKWMSTGYGENIRKFFVENTNPKILVDFAGVKIFENATIDTNILIFSKEKNKHQTMCVVADKINKDILKNLNDFVLEKYITCDFLSSNSWVILSSVEQNIKRKVEKIGVPLKDWNIQINYGVKTGFNDAFIISTETKNKILNNCLSKEERTKTEEIIRPILRGRDIKRYGYNWANLWLINTHNGVKGKFPRVNIEDYPALKDYLDLHWDKISKRTDKGDTPYNLRNCAYLSDFDKPKIMYPNMTQFMPFYYDEKGFYQNDKSFMIVGDKIAFLVAFLNSSLFRYCFTNNFPSLGEKGREVRKIFMDKIPVLQVSDEENSKFIPIIKDIQTEYAKEKAKKIDKMIFELYGLSENEIKIIEQST